MIELPAIDPGLDIIAPFAIRRYNDAVDEQYHLPDLGLGIFIGCSRAFWPRFLDTWRGDPALRASTDPVERWTERVVSEVAARIPRATVVRFAHDEQRVAMQRLADVIGLAALSESYFNIHPTYGPWFASRAVICVDAPPPADAPIPPAKTCACSSACAPLFRDAMAAADRDPNDAEIAERWKVWLAVRDACPVGREHRYSDLQVRYHYTKDRGCIERAAREG